MASFAISPDPEARNLVKSIRVVASSSSSSSSAASPTKHCNPAAAAGHWTARFLLQNHGNFRRSGTPVRIMFYQSGMWTDFPGRVVDSLLPVFAERRSVADVVIGGSNYLFDFLRMLQLDLSSGNRRSIAWIDNGGNCFFPKEFISDEFVNVSENPRIEIEIRINAKSEEERKLGKRTREAKEKENEEQNEVTSSFRDAAPKRQRIADASGPATPRWPNVKPSREGDGAYATVKNVFIPAIRKVHPGATVTAVHKCAREGLMEKARREVFNKQMEITKAARGTANVVYAWYGASVQAVAGVLAHGFGVSSKLSAGVYLSPLASPFRSAMQTEADDNGEKHLILCRVILGKVEKVEAGSQQCYPSSIEYDTGADDPKNPKWFLIWPTNMSRHILPECVVSFKTSDRLPAKLGGVARTKYTFPELFAKIRSSLSPVKVQECITMYDALKAGKMAKDLFIKQFRSVAGEKVLLSAIREVCGAE